MKKLIKLTLLVACIIALHSCQSGSSSPDKKSGGIAVSGSGKDTYLEMTSNTQTSKRQGVQMAMLIKYYISTGGKGRSEMYNVINGKPSLMMAGLMDINNPTQSILLDDSAKTYSINKIDTAQDGNDIVSSHTQYNVSKVGDETIQGLHCVHARIIKTMNFSGVSSAMNSNDTTDIWTTNDLSFPKAFEQASAKGMGLAYNHDVASQLIQMGCNGFPVKFQVHSKSVSSIMQLTKITHDSFPASLFEVPKDYKQTEGF